MTDFKFIFTINHTLKIELGWIDKKEIIVKPERKIIRAKFLRFDKEI